MPFNQKEMFYFNHNFHLIALWVSAFTLSLRRLTQLLTNHMLRDLVRHIYFSGADSGGGGLGGQDPHFIKKGKTLHLCALKRHILVLNSYSDPPFPKSCIRPCFSALCPI